MKRNCKHCDEAFIRKRRNQVYCSASCRTMACYKRNRYQYISGRYQKKVDNKLAVATTTEDRHLPKELNSKLDNLLQKQEKVFDSKSMLNTVTGNLISDGAIYGLKKVFNPASLSATKGDIEQIVLEINKLQNTLAQMKFKNKFDLKWWGLYDKDDAMFSF